MKKICLAVLMAAVGCGILLGWRWQQNYVPELADMESFDPARYEMTYAMQEFQLKPHDRQYFLSSITSYDETGEVEWGEVYRLDESGQAYYMNGEERMYVAQLPRVGFCNITGASDWNVIREQYDEKGRIVYREASHPQIPEHSEITQWYYRTDDQTITGDDAVSTLVFTGRVVIPPGQETFMYDENDEPLMESTSYTILNYDRYGNETMIGFEAKCCMKTDADGYLQMIIRKWGDNYHVMRVDPSGRPLWSAMCDTKNDCVISRTVWKYERLPEEEN